jgi:hypothetical protein
MLDRVSVTFVRYGGSETSYAAGALWTGLVCHCTENDGNWQYVESVFKEEFGVKICF